MFQLGSIGNVELSSRLVRASTWERLANDKTREITPKLLEVYKELAEGGVGLIITSYAYIIEKGRLPMDNKEYTQIVSFQVFGGSQTLYIR